MWRWATRSSKRNETHVRQPPPAVQSRAARQKKEVSVPQTQPRFTKDKNSLPAPTFHCRPYRPLHQPRRNLIPSLYLRCILQQLSRSIEHQSIPALKYVQRRQGLQSCIHPLDTNFALKERIADSRQNRRSPRV